MGTEDDGEIQEASDHHRDKDCREHPEALATPGAESSGTHSPQKPSEGVTGRFLVCAGHQASLALK